MGEPYAESERRYVVLEALLWQRACAACSRAWTSALAPPPAAGDSAPASAGCVSVSSGVSRIVPSGSGRPTKAALPIAGAAREPRRIPPKECP